MNHRAACYFAMYRALCGLLPVESRTGVTPKRIARSAMEANQR